MFEKFSKRNIIILAVLVVALPLAVYLVRQAVKFISRAVPGAVEIFFVPDTATLPPDTAFALTLDAKSNKVGFVRLEVNFDNSKIKLVDEVQVTDKLKTVIEKTSKSEANSSGNIVIVLGLAPGDKDNPPSGVFEFVRLVFTALGTTGSTQISVNDSGVQIVDMGANEIAFSSSSATVTLGPGPTATNTPTPTESPTPTFTKTPTPTPTRTPTPTSTKTPTPTFTKTPTPTNTKTPTPTATKTPTPTPTKKPTQTPTPVYLAGDIDGDGDVDIFDYNLMIENFGETVCGNVADLDSDCDVDIFDYNILIENFGKKA